MSRTKLTLDQIIAIDELFSDGRTTREIADAINVHYKTVYGRTIARQKLRLRGFATVHEYNASLAQQHGFASFADYQKYRVQQAGFDSYAAYQTHLVMQANYRSRHHYQEQKALDAGYESFYQYQRHLARQCSRRPENRSFAHLLKRRMRYFDMNQWELSLTSGVVATSICKYMQGHSLPSEKNWEKLAYALELLPMIPESIPKTSSD